jgi:hypothetical protein
VQIGREQFKDRFIKQGIDGRRGSSSDKKSPDPFSGCLETIELEVKLSVECLHIGTLCTELVHIGVKTAIVAFGVAIGDMDIG